MDESGSGSTRPRYATPDFLQSGSTQEETDGAVFFVPFVTKYVNLYLFVNPFDINVSLVPNWNKTSKLETKGTFTCTTKFTIILPDDLSY